MIITIAAISVCIFYFLMILLFYTGWKRIAPFTAESEISGLLVSVIIPVRNESLHIKELLGDLAGQEISGKHFEVIIIDDHSEDNTFTLIKGICEQHDNIFLYQLNSGEKGKKAAIAVAIEKAKGKLIITTDGDCRMGSKWLSTIAAYYEKYKPKMIISPVLFHKEKNIFQALQSLEFSGLVSSGAGSAGIFRQIMCNGANLAYEKNIFFENKDPMHNEISSGDDIFILHSIKKKYRKDIHFLKSAEAAVYTKAQPDISSFLSQRARWVSKSAGYSDLDSIITAMLVFLMNISLIVTFIAGCFNLFYLKIFLVIFIAKSLADFLLLHSFLKFFNKQKLLFWFIPLQFVYFIYVSLIGAFGSFIKVRWKGRKVR